MSYVIQNFYDCNRKVALTPRFKFLFLLINLKKIIVFMKLNTFLNLNNSLNHLGMNYFSLFFKYFFAKIYTKMLFNSNLKSSGNYTNNLSKSSVYLIFFSSFLYLKKTPTYLFSFNFNKNYPFNSYFLPIKIINTYINKTFYKNIFFYLMFISPFLWYQHSSNLKFYLNFLFINYNLKTSRFFNTHFLKIHNY